MGSRKARLLPTAQKKVAAASFSDASRLPKLRQIQCLQKLLQLGNSYFTYHHNREGIKISSRVRNTTLKFLGMV